jgi:hypothetical protein
MTAALDRLPGIRTILGHILLEILDAGYQPHCLVSSGHDRVAA